MRSKDDFLKNLTGELKAVQPLWSPQLRFILWSFVSLVIIIGVMLAIQPFRSGVLSQLQNKRFFLESLFSFLPFLAFGFLCLKLAVPGLKVSRGVFFLGLSPLILFLFSMAYGYWVSPSLSPTMAGKRPHCFHEVLVLSWIPIFIAVHLVRRAHAFVNIRLTFMIGLASSALPMSLMQIACMYDPYHILSHHILGAGIVTFVMTILGLFLLRKSN